MPGCELHLFQPRKQGNLDCTFCLDCVHACPHDNVGVLAVVPGQALWSDPLRSGVGRFSRRPDLAALVVVLVFGAFANAAGMVGPVVEWQEKVCFWLGNAPPIVVTSVLCLLAIVVLPLLAVVGAAALSRQASGRTERVPTLATRYAFALVPIGFSMWLAHYTFHFFTSWGGIVPVAQRFAADRGWHALGEPLWQCACCGSVANWITHWQILALDCGLLASLYAGFRIAESQTAHSLRAVKVLAPWAILMLLLFAAGIWIVFQPMEMRGTMLAAG